MRLYQHNTTNTPIRFTDVPLKLKKRFKAVVFLFIPSDLIGKQQASRISQNETKSKLTQVKVFLVFKNFIFKQKPIKIQISQCVGLPALVLIAAAPQSLQILVSCFLLRWFGGGGGAVT